MKAGREGGRERGDWGGRDGRWGERDGLVAHDNPSELL